MPPITLAVRVEREIELKFVNLDLRVVQSTEAASMWTSYYFLFFKSQIRQIPDLLSSERHRCLWCLRNSAIPGHYGRLTCITNLLATLWKRRRNLELKSHLAVACRTITEYIWLFMFSHDLNNHLISNCRMRLALSLKK